MELCLRHQVRCVEASAFLDLTPQVVRYRAAGLSRHADGRVVAANRIIAKVSRAEVAERFLRPAPEAMLRSLVESRCDHRRTGRAGPVVPMADDLTAEADSGGHTDRRPLVVLLPELIALRDRIQGELRYERPVRVGAAGGIGTPAAAAAAFAMGAAYVVTGSVNQACVEADQSPAAKELLASAGVADCAMAPSADMFEMGVDVQVLQRGTMFPGRARRLYELYRTPRLDRVHRGQRAHGPGEARLPTAAGRGLGGLRAVLRRARPGADRARAGQPKRRMALVFRWYLGQSSGWSIRGVPDRAADYQIWCGPAMGAFNEWVAGTHLAAPAHRGVAEVATHIMRGAAFTARIGQLRMAGVRLPAECATYIPAPPGDGSADHDEVQR